MATKVTYINFNDTMHAKYDNLYFINNDFYYLTIEKNTILKGVITFGGPKLSKEDTTMCPKIIYFPDMEKLTSYVKSLDCVKLKKPTLYFTHFFQHNIAHGLFDALYPIYLCYLRFFGNDDFKKLNLLITLLEVNGWKMPANYIPCRDWVLNVFKDFTLKGSTLFKNNIDKKYNIKFSTLLAGNYKLGLSVVNEKFEMYGKELFALENFRNRFFKAYNIVKKDHGEKINIIVLNNDNRYSYTEKNELKKILNYFSKKENVNIDFIDWKNIPIFKNQLELINKYDIHISGCGTNMFNFPFLNDNSIHINLGSSNYNNVYRKPSLMETNIFPLSNTIYCDQYDIYKHKSIKYEEVKNLIEKNIENFKNKTKLVYKIPKYVEKWQLFCKKFPNKAKEIIKQAIGEKSPNMVNYRFPDTIMHYYPNIYNNI